jgi:hypothetical protein
VQAKTLQDLTYLAQASRPHFVDVLQISGGCVNGALQARSEFRRTAVCKARLFFPRFLLARQKKSGRRRAISGLCKQTHNKNKTIATRAILTSARAKKHPQNIYQTKSLLTTRPAGFANSFSEAGAMGPLTPRRT